MTRKDFQELLKKVNAGKASREEEKALFDWYDSFTKEPLPKEGVLTELEQDELLVDVRSRTRPDDSTNLTFTVIFKLAAAVILAGFLVLAWYAYDQHQKESDLQYTIVPKGQKHKLILPDSSIVWLNADSKLSYPKVFRGNRRDVTLSGEGYFEVKHDASRPFTVHTKDMEVRVLGTVFDIKAYLQDKNVETSLILGSVQVKVINGDKNIKPVILRPNQKFVLSNAPGPTGADLPDGNRLQNLVKEIPGSQMLRETGWRKNSFSFENEQLSELVPKLERWFNISVLIQNPQLNNLRFTGTLDNASLDTVMQALMLSGHFNYRKEADHTIIIY